MSSRVPRLLPPPVHLARLLVLVVPLLCLAGHALAQDADTPPSGSSSAAFDEVVDVRVVNVEVFVEDRDGRPVTGLGHDDFELLVDGDPMPITNFYSESEGRMRETVRPLERRTDSRFTPIETTRDASPGRAHVLLLVDHSRLRSANRRRAFDALRKAVAELEDDALVAVAGIEGSLVFYSDFLYDRRAIGEILDEIENVTVDVNLGDAERRRVFSMLARGQSGGLLGRVASVDAEEMLATIRVYASEEYARSLRSLEQIEAVVSTLGGAPGRKALLYVGEGVPQRPGEGMWVEWRNRFGGGNPNASIGLRRFDFNTDYTRDVGRFDLTRQMAELAAVANRADVTLYAIDAEGDHGGELRSALTEQGATSESVSVVDENFRAPLESITTATGGRLLRSSGELVEQLGEVIDDFATFYSLGFMPPTEWDAGSEHEVEVRVRSRRGLRVRHRESVRLPKPGEAEASATITALMYQTVQNPLGISAKPGTEAPREDGTAALPILLEIPVGKLSMLPQGETHAISLTLYVSIKDARGNPGPVQKIPFHLDIPSDKLEQAKEQSAHYPLPLVLRPGDRQVAIGVRDEYGGVFSALRVDVERFSQNL